MKFIVDPWNNFLRVFELPKEFSSEFCFGGGIPTIMYMVDWFYTYSQDEVPVAAVPKHEYDFPIKTKELTDKHIYNVLIPFIREKTYVRPDREYLILFDCGAAVRFNGKK